jgi:hypothetical protein
LEGNLSASPASSYLPNFSVLTLLETTYLVDADYSAMTGTSHLTLVKDVLYKKVERTYLSLMKTNLLTLGVHT